MDSFISFSLLSPKKICTETSKEVEKEWVGDVESMKEEKGKLS
jgi:hypothetical protein